MKEGWKAGRLGEFFEVVTGGTPPKGNTKMYGDFMPLVKPPELIGGEIYAAKDNLSLLGAEAAKVLPIGSTLVSCIGNLGKVGINMVPLSTNQQINAIKPNKQEALPELVFYMAQSPVFTKQLVGSASGTTVPIVNKSKFKNIAVLLPPLSEQKRIVAILDEAFAGIATAVANTEKNLANARELFESYLNTIFTFPPDHWNETKFGQICSIKHGFAFKSQYFAQEGDYVVLTPGSFWENGGFRDQGRKTKYYTGEIPEGYILKSGDFLIAMTEQAVGLLGSSLIVPESERYLHNQRLGLVQRADDCNWHNDFFFHQFNTRAFRTAVQATASGVKVRHTSPKKLGEIKVKFPATKAEQIEVANKLNEILSQSHRLERIYQRKLTALAELKQSLLQKAFSGELTADKGEVEAQEAVA